MNKKQKIKDFFSRLTSERKDAVRKKIAEQFGVSIDTAKIHWIYGGGVPDQHVSTVLDIIKNELKQHADEIIARIDAP